jgi:hypothetical protein
MVGPRKVFNWARGHPRRIGLLIGLAAGLEIGIFDAVDSHNVLYLLTGIPFGLAFALRFAFEPRPRGADLRHLDPYQRRRVIAAVRRGECPEDPALGPSVIQQADAIIRPRRFDDRFGPFLFLAFGALCLVLVVLDLDSGDTIGALGYGAGAVLFIACAFWSPVQRQRQVERARRARALAISPPTNATKADQTDELPSPALYRYPRPGGRIPYPVPESWQHTDA